ncbi:aminotransferase class I/II-fold pyridoxal phosphate-dependent enzyme [Streptomyces buecherae]|uniref:Aminotransferase class I/II-fold pyridoxal phosphate-dependent enzyme n=1 Tax=Streptomyces buecherae TaxID=2763006 RepID=A0A7H8N3U3_9ACTN|nr:aminotransferase class I/II-fold pyridoxal phosphate-dependent enzyme [Streptomyces buecherae]QKW49105.1 aminotransferase class I/II-fold pyridoxal phosphate-dependent enzyme [Streptomyces buecherae]
MQRPAPAPHSAATPWAAEGALPPLPELAARLAAATGRSQPEPVGGAPELHRAACGYWARRGLHTAPDQVFAGAGGQPLLLALLAASGGDVLLTRPSAAWYAPLARLAGRPTYHAPAPAPSGGVPDPFALLETVRRVRAEGGDPRVLVLAVADDPTGTVAPPELLHEVCEAAAAEDLLIISDETWRDTVHPTAADPPPTAATGPPPRPGGAAPPEPADGPERPATGWPGETVVVSPAEMVPDRVVVLTDLAGALTPPSWPAAIARLPASDRGAELHAGLLAALGAVRGELPAPVAAAALHALHEPAPVRARTAAAARAYGAVGTAAYDRLTDLGVLSRPPRAGHHLYVDLAELRGPLAERGIADAVDLERHLTRRLGRPVPGGHRFGDAPDDLRVRLSTLPLLGADDEQRLATLAARDPLERPHVRAALTLLESAFSELTPD